MFTLPYRFLLKLSLPLLVLAILFATAPRANAHGDTAIGEYDLEFGWVNEPPIVGQSNAVVINLTHHGAAPESELDVSALKVAVAYGGQTSTLTLQPAHENSTGEFVAPLIPTLPGVYTIQLSGTFENSPVEVEFEPEEVQPAAVIQFPPVAASQPAAGLNWMDYAGLALGLVGAILGGLALGLQRKA